MDGNNALPTKNAYTRFGQDDIVTDSGGKYGYDVGGEVEHYSAGAALNVGDVVYLSAANTANKSATAGTTLGKLLGVVVGGTKTDLRAVSRKLDVGVQAAATGEVVLVQVSGKVWAVSDAAITAGDILAAGTSTAGRVKTGTITTDLAAGSSGNIVGNALEAAAGAAVTIMIRLRMM
jgi:hypothetical protein